MSKASMQQAFEQALRNTVKGASPSGMFELVQKGRRNF